MDTSLKARAADDGADRPGWGAIAVGIDGSGADRAAVAYAFAEAARRGGQLIAIHVWTAPPRTLADESLPVAYAYDNAFRTAARLMTDVLSGYAAQYPGVPVCPEIACEADVTQALLRISRRADLMVVGATTSGSELAKILADRGGCPVAVITQST
jgi:nucleotide-binding universal stress UspA family protein